MTINDERTSATIELWQTEWCPASHRVRQRLTELDLPFLARAVPVLRDDRDELEHATGTRTIPVLVSAGQIIDGEEGILAHLNTHYTEPAEVHAQRAKAAMAKRKERRSSGSTASLTSFSAPATRSSPAPRCRPSRISAFCCHATSSSTPITARRTSPRSTPKRCSQSSRTRSLATPRPRFADGWKPSSTLRPPTDRLCAVNSYQGPTMTTRFQLKG